MEAYEIGALNAFPHGWKSSACESDKHFLLSIVGNHTLLGNQRFKGGPQHHQLPPPTSESGLVAELCSTACE